MHAVTLPQVHLAGANKAAGMRRQADHAILHEGFIVLARFEGEMRARWQCPASNGTRLRLLFALPDRLQKLGCRSQPPDALARALPSPHIYYYLFPLCTVEGWGVGEAPVGVS